jgi:hypothetical protein
MSLLESSVDRMDRLSRLASHDSRGLTVSWVQLLALDIATLVGYG